MAAKPRAGFPGRGAQSCAMRRSLAATAAIALSLAGLPSARAQQSDLLTESLTISTGPSVDLAAFAEDGVPNVFVFYNATSSADRALVESIMARRRGSNQVGVHLIRLSDLNAPIAKRYNVAETPLVIVRDRFGKEQARTSKIDEVLPAVIAALKVARLKWVDEADPRAAEVYKNLGGGSQRVPGILKTMSLQPEWMDLIDKLSNVAHFSDTALPRRIKEMIATYVSGINRCKY